MLLHEEASTPGSERGKCLRLCVDMEGNSPRLSVRREIVVPRRLSRLLQMEMRKLQLQLSKLHRAASPIVSDGRTSTDTC